MSINIFFNHTNDKYPKANLSIHPNKLSITSIPGIHYDMNQVSLRP